MTFNGLRYNMCRHCVHASHCLLSSSDQLSASLLQFPSRHLKRGQHLCYQGQPSENLYILRAGLLKSYVTKFNGEEFVMGFYLPPDLFGFEGLEERDRSMSISALEDSNICVISLAQLHSLTKQAPDLSKQLMHMVSRRIHQDNIALLRTTAQQRVATFLLQLAARYEQLGHTATELELWMTHQDIANYLRITAHTISRIFHHWHRKKIISLEKHRVTLLRADEIRMIAES